MIEEIIERIIDRNIDILCSNSSYNYALLNVDYSGL